MSEPRLSVELRQDAPVPLDVRFTCNAGDVLAIFGPSGAGKTTILRAIAGLRTPAHARIEVGGQTWTDTVSGLSVPVHERAVGFVFQDYALFPHLTALGNVETALGHLPRHERASRAQTLLRRVHLSADADRRSVSTLSGGERQRVALARALAREPGVLLLDEPFAAVDLSVRRHLQDEVDALRQSLAIPTILVTHDLDDVFRLASHVLIVENGRSIICDTVSAVTSHPGGGALRRLIGSGSVVSATVSRADDSRGLTWLDVGGAEIVVPFVQAGVGTTLRLRVPAREVILASERPSGLSLHNALPATVKAVESDSDSRHSIVQLAVGQVTLLAEVTRDAVQSLQIGPGRALFALIKSVSVELLGSRAAR
ncbi:MAG: molybdenum ABC transporter ATP-binding protein [Vicinamibacterales bacterium]